MTTQKFFLTQFRPENLTKYHFLLKMTYFTIILARIENSPGKFLISWWNFTPKIKVCTFFSFCLNFLWNIERKLFWDFLPTRFYGQFAMKNLTFRASNWRRHYVFTFGVTQLICFTTCENLFSKSCRSNFWDNAQKSCKIILQWLRTMSNTLEDFGE